MLRIDPLRCTGCGMCVEACPFSALEMVGDRPVVNDACTLCSACVEACQRGAIALPASSRGMRRGRAMVIAELAENGFREVTLELLGKARELCEGVDALVVGPEDVSMGTLFDHGAHRVVHVPAGERTEVDALASVMREAVRAEAPAVLLLGATPWGRELAPRLASALGVGLTADCTSLEMDGEGRMLQTRPAFGGEVMATIVSRREPQMATVRPHVLVSDRRYGTEGDVSRSDIEIPGSPISLISETSLKGGGDIGDAPVLVAVGMGVSPEHIPLAESAASLLGGRLACSRAMVEAGLLPRSEQVGQSGRTVSPDLYIAIGVSGAVQHLVGMSSSGRIVAVNSDPEAPIHSVADLSVIGDSGEFLEELVRALVSR